MISLEQQVQLSGDLAKRFLAHECETSPLDAWHSGIEAVRTHIGDPDPALTEDLLDVSAIAYHTRIYGRQLLRGEPFPSAEETLEHSADILYDLTRQHSGTARRCGNYLLTAYAICNGPTILTVTDGRLNVTDSLRGQLVGESTFCHPELLPIFWNIAGQLACRETEVQ